MQPLKNTPASEINGPARHPGSGRRVSSSFAAIAALTLVALGLRLEGIDESLFADEIYTYRIVATFGLLDVVPEVHDTAITPPLHYLLAKVAVQFGEPSIWIRMPSVILGAATVPIAYLLGLRTVGRQAALVGAALAAITPFAVFYGTEARAYATMMFLCALSTLCLLTAIDTGRRRWFAAYALSAALVLYSHYSGVFVVAAQAVWGLVAHRGHLRALLLANAAIAVAYLPWLPSFFFQGSEHPPEQISLVAPVTLDSFVDAILATFPGRPFVVLGDVPGPTLLVAIVAALAIALVGIAWRRRGEPLFRASDRPSRELVLLVVLAVATPLGIVGYSLVETSLFGPRNLAASLPFVWLLIGRLVSAPRGAPALAASVLLVGAVAVTTARSLDDDYRRSPFRDAAQFVDARADRCDPVVELLWLNPRNALSKALPPHLKQTHPGVRIGKDDRSAWRVAARSKRVFVVAPQVDGFRGASWNARLGGRFTLRQREIYPGAIPVAAYEYVRTGPPRSGPRIVRRGGDAIAFPNGETLAIGTAQSPGAVEIVHAQQETIKVAGWAVDTVKRRPASRVLVFEGSCLVLSGKPSIQRRDIVDLYGPRAGRSGFRLTAVPVDPVALSRSSRLRAFGVSGRRVWELPPLRTAFREPTT